MIYVQIYLKKAALLACFFLCGINVHSQSQNWWKIDGNSNGSNNTFIGTTNYAPLLLKSNNQSRVRIDESGSIYFYDFSGTGKGLLTYDSIGLLGKLSLNGNGTKLLTDNGQFIDINTATGWTISGNALYNTTHHVGIGTANPSERLTVAGNALVTGIITTSGLNVLQKIEADTLRGFVSLNVNGNLVLGEDGNYNGITAKQYDLQINSKPGHNFNTILNTNTNGNVGIGTANPQYKLHVLGNTGVSGLLYADSLKTLDFSVGKLHVTDSIKVGASSIWIGGQMLGTANHIYSTNGPLSLQNQKDQTYPYLYNADYNIIANLHSGRMGIGTANPQTKLHVKGVLCPDCPQPGGPPPTETTFISIEDEIVNQQGNVLHSTTWRLAATAIQDRFFIGKLGTPSSQFTILSTGHVGIGIAAPTARLQVFHNTPNVAGIITGDTAARSLWLVPYLNQGGYNPIAKEGDVGIIFRNGNQNSGKSGLVIAPHNNSERGIRINDNGTVSINTYVTPIDIDGNPFTLTVNGKVLAEEYVAILKNEWPDYVFEEDLMPFEQFRLSIEEKGHFPNLPSAKEIHAAKSFSMAGVQVSHLAITEYLYRYLVELYDGAAKTKTENEHLQAEVNAYKQTLQELEKRLQALEAKQP